MSKGPDDRPAEDWEAFPLEPAAEGAPSGNLENTRSLDTPSEPDALADPTEHEGGPSENLEITGSLDAYALGYPTEGHGPGKDRKLGKYVISGLIGRGGMGLVWKGFDPDLQCPVAIKVLGGHLAHSPTSRRRFQREGRAAAAISHPNVVTVHAVEEHGEAPYLVMEYVSGGSLKDYVKKCGKLDAMEVIRLSCQIAQGLAAAHAQGVIHRDVKPGNVMLHEGASRARLTDFGLARVVYDNADLSSHDQLIGTPAYTCPEQIRGPHVDARADLFSLGCVMFFMLTGQSPWQGRNQAETIHKISTATPPRLHELDPAVPQALSDIVERLLQKNPDDRFQSASEVADILRRFLLQLNQTTSDELPAVLNGQKLEITQPRRWSAQMAVRLGLAPALLAAVAVSIWGIEWRGWLATPGPSRPANSPANTPQVNSPVPVLSKLTSITVGPDSDADCATIAEAISRAAENCTITVTGPGPYAEAVRLSGSSLRGLKLQARPRAVWRTAKGSAPCLSISDATDVSVAGFDFEIHAETSRAVAVAGEIDGLSLVDCEFRHMLPDHRLSLVLIGSRAGKTEEQVRIQGCRFYVAQGSVMGVAIGGLSEAASRVRCEECLFSSPHVHIYVTQTCQQLLLARNVFLGGDNGVNISFKSWSPDCRVEIVNNTFVGTRYWIGFMDSFRGGEFPSGRTDSRVCNNLILGGERVQGGADQWEPVLSSWKFAGNFWEIDDTTKRSANYDERIAVFRDKFDVPVRDAPLDPRFLVPAADSPLWTMGVGGDLPQYVGAKVPDSTKP